MPHRFPEAVIYFLRQSQVYSRFAHLSSLTRVTGIGESRSLAELPWRLNRQWIRPDWFVWKTSNKMSRLTRTVNFL